MRSALSLHFPVVTRREEQTAVGCSTVESVGGARAGPGIEPACMALFRSGEPVEGPCPADFHRILGLSADHTVLYIVPSAVTGSNNDVDEDTRRN